MDTLDISLNFASNDIVRPYMHSQLVVIIWVVDSNFHNNLLKRGKHTFTTILSYEPYGQA